MSSMISDLTARVYSKRCHRGLNSPKKDFGSLVGLALALVFLL